MPQSHTQSLRTRMIDQTQLFLTQRLRPRPYRPTIRYRTR